MKLGPYMLPSVVLEFSQNFCHTALSILFFSFLESDVSAFSDRLRCFRCRNFDGEKGFDKGII